DGLAVYVNNVYDNPSAHQSPALLLATFAFAWQIYFDFSGYSDMARGVARMFGFKIMLNFNNPYLATGLSDFWQRWHISLSAWFRDYVYIPLGGNRKGNARTYFNLFLTMVVSGLWHGAAWTFIIWGAVHGLGVGLTRGLEQSVFYKEKVPRLAKQVLCFLIVSFAWIFFKAKTWDDACLIINRIFTSGISDPSFPLIILALILPIWLYQFVYESRARQILQFVPLKVALVVLMILYMAVFSGSAQPFTYDAF
ncbi:MAG: MBOAT family protein, partial [Kiritimatiellae bacterium]|nr:MBOAT family protein [Kiritimatiellia bacterium]